MKNNFWKIEYSVTFLVMFAVLLFMIPTSFSSKNANHISKWNEEYNKIEYMFSAISAQAGAEIAKGTKSAKQIAEREKYMMQLIKPYLRLKDRSKHHSRYHLHYMSGDNVKEDDIYNFDTLYESYDGVVVGIKDIENRTEDDVIFMIMIDTNGYKRPNMWGVDIFGVDIYPTGKVKPLGSSWELDELRKDCSKTGSGISCSHFYRIGGEFNE